MTKRAAAGLLSLSLLPLLSGCALLPEETTYAHIPLTSMTTATEYQYCYVLRGNLALTESMSCRYVPVQDSALSFGTSGVLYDTFYVKKGDQVKKGDLLATLVMGTLTQDIATAEATLASLTMNIDQLQAQKALALSQQQTLLAMLTREQAENEATLDEVAARYDTRLNSLADDVQIQTLRLDALRRQKEKRELRADIDGAVTYVRSVKSSDRSVEGSTIITIADASYSVFTAKTASYALLQPGDIVSIIVRKQPYEARVTAAADLGLSDVLANDEKKRAVYFSLLQPAVDLDSGDTGTLTLTLEEHPDTLYIEKKAVHAAGDGFIVYYPDPETGIRGARFVETGLETSKYIEILSGLAEGDKVILK